MCLEDTSPEIQLFLEKVDERIIEVYGQDYIKTLKMAINGKVDIDLREMWHGDQTMNMVHQVPGIESIYGCMDQLPLTSRQKEQLFEILKMPAGMQFGRGIDFNLVRRLSQDYPDSFIERYFYAYLISYFVLQSQIWDELPPPPIL